MPLLHVSINDKHYIVDSPDVRTAKSWAKSQVTIEVSEATAMDIREHLPAGADIPVLGAAHNEEMVEMDGPVIGTVEAKATSRFGIFGK